MPRNKTGGKGYKRQKNSTGGSRKPEDIAKQKEESEVYGQVLKATGNRRFNVKCQPFDDKSTVYVEVNCGLKGSVRKRVSEKDYVLVQYWDEFGSCGAEKKASIIDVYSVHEQAKLDSKGLWDYTPDVEIDESAGLQIGTSGANKDPEDTVDGPDVIGIEGGMDADIDDDIDIDAI